MFDLDKYIFFSENMERYRRKKYTPAEQAIIIVMSNKCCLDEKIQDLQNLIEVGANVAVCKDAGLLIQLWSDILADRYNNAGVIFMANLKKYGAENDKISAYRFFSSYDKALKFLQTEKDCFKDCAAYGEIWRMEVDTDDPECDIYYFDNDMKLSNIVCCSKRSEMDDMKLFRYMQYVPDADMNYNIKIELEKMNFRKRQ